MHQDKLTLKPLRGLCAVAPAVAGEPGDGYCDPMLPTRQAHLFGLLLLLSVAPLGAPSLEGLWPAASSGLLPAAGAVVAGARGRFDYSGTCRARGMWALDVGEWDAPRRREGDEDEDEEDDNKKRRRRARRDNSNEEREKAGERDEDVMPVERRELLVHGDSGRRSAFSGSSIGSGGSSTHLVDGGSGYTSVASTPRKVASLLHLAASASLRHVCSDDNNNNDSNYYTNSFNVLPDTALLTIISFLAFPQVITLFHTSKRLSSLVKTFFNVNEHGVLRIPAFTGRSLFAHRWYDRYSFMNRSGYKDNSTVVTNNISTSADATTDTACKNEIVSFSSSFSSPEPQPQQPAKTIRLFFGQQRRDNHPSSLRHLLTFLVPDVVIPHMESHTNPLNGRGKGCTWVFVTSLIDAGKLMQFNKLVFLDIDEDNNEFYMVAPPRSREWIQNYADEVCKRPSHPKYLPRQPMVIEMPDKPSVKRKKMRSQLQKQREMQMPQAREMACTGKSDKSFKTPEHHELNPYHHPDGGPNMLEEKTEEMRMITPPYEGSLRVADVGAITPLWDKCRAEEPTISDTCHSNISLPRTRRMREYTPKACEVSPARNTAKSNSSHRKCHNPYFPTYRFYSNIYTTVVYLGGGMYRHDPYMYNPMWLPAEPQMLYEAVYDESNI